MNCLHSNLQKNELTVRLFAHHLHYYYGLMRVWNIHGDNVDVYDLIDI